MRLSIVIVNFNTRALLARCLEVFADTLAREREIFVVDNGSTDGSAELVRQRFPAVRLIRNTTNEMFSRANNQALRCARGDYVLLLNTDVELSPRAALRLIRSLDEDESIAAVAPRFVDREGRTQACCMSFPSKRTTLFYETHLGRLFPHAGPLERYYLRDWDHEDARPVEQPPAACFLVRRSVFDQVGRFDERMPLFFSDVDLCLRMKQAGLRILYQADATAFHHVGATTRTLENLVTVYHQDRITYYRKHFGRAGAWLTKACLIDVAANELIKATRRGAEPAAFSAQARSIGRALRDCLSH